MTMLRRTFWSGLLAGSVGASIPRWAFALTSDEAKRRAEAFDRIALENFPLELIETTGRDAPAKWNELRSAGRGSPVVLGYGDDAHPLGALLGPFGTVPEGHPPPRSVDAIAKVAEGIRFPGDLAARKAAASEGVAAGEPGSRVPPIGEWPASPNRNSALSVLRRPLTGDVYPKVLIGVARTDDWTTVPAILRWGGWNDCPAAEYHIAALRWLRDRYGAVLVGLNFDTLNLWVEKKPGTREEALALARDLHVYCPDLIDQDLGTYSAFAADLMANNWWNFWWD